MTFTEQQWRPAAGAPARKIRRRPPQLNVLGQYVKDFSFENPNAPRSLAPTQEQPQLNIQINVGVDQLAPTDYEVTLKLEGKAEVPGHGAVRLRPDLLRHVPHPEHPAGARPADGHDRVPAAAVPVRARDRRDRGAQRRLSRRSCSIRSISFRCITSGWRSSTQQPQFTMPT